MLYLTAKTFLKISL